VYAKALAGVFKTAIEGAGQKDKKSRPAIWWTQEYKDTYKAYLVLRRLSDTLTPEKKGFLTIVRRAKREY
jgi:hypothetical protein